MGREKPGKHRPAPTLCPPARPQPPLVVAGPTHCGRGYVAQSFPVGMAQVAGELAVLDVPDIDGADPPHRWADTSGERLSEWWGLLLDCLELHAQNAPVFGAEPGAHMPDVTQLADRVVGDEYQRPESTPRTGIQSAHITRWRFP